MKGVDRESKPMLFPATTAATTARGLTDNTGPDGGGGKGVQEGSNRWPKPMQGFDREPKSQAPPTSLTTHTTGVDSIQPDHHSPPPSKRRQVQGNRRGKTIELGVFLDQAAYDRFFPHLASPEVLSEFLLSYINGIQALFLHPSLGQNIQLVINYVEVMVQQPPSLLPFLGDREKLYDSFRLYNKKKVAETANQQDIDPWDIGLLISGRNIFNMKDPGGNDSPVGLTAVRGVCHPDYSAVLMQLGATDMWDKISPFVSFASVHAMAHEIGHNLGMLHDGHDNPCPKVGHVMSASRATGEVSWSLCSRVAINAINATCLNNQPASAPKKNPLPGQNWDADDQCRAFLKDDEATLHNETLDHSICSTVMCHSPNRNGCIKAGPALDGTFCGNNRVCVAGECRPWRGEGGPPVVAGGWSPWEEFPCTSGCLLGARGVQVSKRRCNNPKPKNTKERCQGPSTTLKMCQDLQICSGTRIPVTRYASDQCKKFSRLVKDLRPTGTQAPHNPERLRQACAIFCERASGVWYSPGEELSYLPHFDVYFPDGTQCHEEAGVQYYCQRHQCLPEGPEGSILQKPEEWIMSLRPSNLPTPFSDISPKRVSRVFKSNQIMDPFQLGQDHDHKDMLRGRDYLQM